MDFIERSFVLVGENIVLNLFSDYDGLVREKRWGQCEGEFYTAMHLCCLANWNIFIPSEQRDKGAFSSAGEAHDENVKFLRLWTQRRRLQKVL